MLRRILVSGLVVLALGFTACDDVPTDGPEPAGEVEFDPSFDVSLPPDGGTCPDVFYEAYQDAFPLPAGWQRRVNVYVLYHLLNHLNLFGGGYRDQSRRLAAEILRPSSPS